MITKKLSRKFKKIPGNLSFGPDSRTKRNISINLKKKKLKKKTYYFVMPQKSRACGTTFWAVWRRPPQLEKCSLKMNLARFFFFFTFFLHEKCELWWLSTSTSSKRGRRLLGHIFFLIFVYFFDFDPGFNSSRI
jgi:hypothetical protein